MSPPDTAATSGFEGLSGSFNPLFSPSSVVDETFHPNLRSPVRARSHQPVEPLRCKQTRRLAESSVGLSLVAHLLGARAGSGVCFAVWLSALRGRHASQRSARTSAGAACLVVSPRSLRRCRTALQTCASGNALCRGKQVLPASALSHALSHCCPGTDWEGGVYPVELEIPVNYPDQPPFARMPAGVRLSESARLLLVLTDLIVLPRQRLVGRWRLPQPAEDRGGQLPASDCGGLETVGRPSRSAAGHPDVAERAQLGFCGQRCGSRAPPNQPGRVQPSRAATSTAVPAAMSRPTHPSYSTSIHGA